MVKLLDAGFSTQLSKYIDEEIDGHPLWTARFLFTSKETCLRVHRDFVRAGSDIIHTATYQATIEGYKKHLGLTEEESIALIKESVAVARQAISLESEKHSGMRDVLVAGAVGPYGAHLHDGSEYRGDYADRITKQELKDWHTPKIRALLDGGVDVLALETVPCSLEAFALIEVLKEFPTAKAWLSFSLKSSDRISNGEMFTEVAAKCWDLCSDQLIAIGANCFNPSWVTPLMKQLKTANADIPFIAYPNSGETYDTDKGRWEEKSSNREISDYLKEWLNLGISYIGCCCRTSDNDISKMQKEIQKFCNIKDS